MSLSIHDIASHTFTGGLSTLRALLDKAAAHAEAEGIEVSSLLGARLAPNMFDFTRQIQSAADVVRRGIDRLSNEDVTSVADEETTIDELRARIDSTLERLKAANVGAIDDSEDRKFDVALGKEVTLPFTGRSYLLGFAIPNFLFHVTTAYDILRSQGVALGKRDYIAPFVAAS
jgi:hypothetical protein